MNRCFSIRFVLLLAFIAFMAGPALASQVGSGTLLSLSTADRQWLQAHPVIRLGIDANYAPYSFIGERGAVKGIVPEYLPLLENALGIRFEITSHLE